MKKSTAIGILVAIGLCWISFSIAECTFTGHPDSMDFSKTSDMMLIPFLIGLITSQALAGREAVKTLWGKL